MRLWPLAEQADVVDRRLAAQGDFEVVVELELMRRAAKLSVAHRPRAGSPIAIPDGTLDGSGDVAIVSAPLDGLLARPIGQPFAFAIALEEELEAPLPAFRGRSELKLVRRTIGPKLARRSHHYRGYSRGTRYEAFESTRC